MIKYQAKIYKDSDAYSVEFPDLPGCFSSGETLEEAKAMATEALTLYLEEARDPKWDIPKAKSRKSRGFYWIAPSPEVAIPLMLRKVRQKLSLSQNQAVKKLGITVQQLQKLETPGKSNSTIKTLSKISQAFDIEIDLVA